MLALTALFTLLSTGIIRSWAFWLILIVFLTGVLRIPVSALQLAGILPRQDPAWYVVLEAAVGLIQFVIALAMLAGYRKAGVGVILQLHRIWTLLPLYPSVPLTPVSGCSTLVL